MAVNYIIIYAKPRYANAKKIFDSDGADVGLHFEKWRRPINEEVGYAEIVPLSISGTVGLSEYIMDKKNSLHTYTCGIATTTWCCIIKDYQYRCTIIRENTGAGSIFKLRLKPL